MVAVARTRAMPKPPSPRRRPPLRQTPRVRPAVESDQCDLVRLENETFDSDRLSARQWARHLRSDSAGILVAPGKPDLLGALVLFFRRGSDIARLYSLAIAANARGQGIGNRLLAAGEQAARNQGCSRLRLEVRRDNRAAQRLYQRRGYRVIGERSAYYADGEDAVRYEKSLADA